jgi:hypothetical protein
MTRLAPDDPFRFVRVAVLLVSAAAPMVAACGSPDESAEPPEANEPCQPTFASIERTVLSSCVAGACHAAGNASGAFVFEGADEAGVVSGVSEAACEGVALVVPGDPGGSLLYRKLVDSPPFCGVKMPQVGTIDERDIDCIHDWLEAL